MRLSLGRSTLIGRSVRKGFLEKNDKKILAQSNIFFQEATKFIVTSQTGSVGGGVKEIIVS